MTLHVHRRALVGAALVILCATGAVAQTWIRAHGIGGYNRAFDIRPTDDGGFVVVGDTEAGSSIYRQYSVVKLYQGGNVEWRRDFGTSRWDIPRAVRQTLDGGYLVVGESGYLQGHFAATTLRDYWVVRLDAGGDILWQRAYGGADHDYAHDVLVLPDGGAVVAGYTLSFGAGCTDIWLLRLDPDGNVLWQQAYGGADCDRVYEIIRAHDGGFIMTGHVSNTSVTDMDLLVMKVDTEGNVDWSRLYGPDGNAQNDWGYSISGTEDGGYVVGATTSSFGGVAQDWLLLKLDGAGAVSWAKVMDGSRSALSPGEKMGAARPTPDGGYLIAGGRPSSRALQDQDLWLQKLDGQGDLVWGRLYDGDDTDVANALQVLPDGGLIVAGETGSYDVGSFWTLRLGPFGFVVAGCGVTGVSAITPSSVTVPVVDVTLTLTTTSVTGQALDLVEGVGAAGQLTQCMGPPAEVSPIGASQPLTWTDDDTLVWQDGVASNAETFNAYRSHASDMTLEYYGDCLQGGLTAPTAQDSSWPEVADAFTYLVTGENLVGEGGMGFASTGNARPNNAACP